MTFKYTVKYVFLLLYISSISYSVQHNVLFIAIDDLRAELGVYGSKVVKSPNIDKLARKGITFQRAYCQFSMCSPSRSSVLTGTRPDTTGVYDLKTFFRDRMGDDILTLPGYFKAYGYESRGIGKVFHPIGKDDGDKTWSNHWLPCDRPHYPNQFTNSMSGTFSDLNSQNNDFKNIQMENTLYHANVGVEVNSPVMGSAKLDDNYFRDGCIARTAISTLRELSIMTQTSKEDGSTQPHPFFLAVGFTKPHLPFIAPTKYWDLYKRSELPTCPQQFQLNAPLYALDIGGEMFGFADSSHYKPSKRRTMVKSSSSNRGKLKSLVMENDPLNETLQRHFRHGYYAATSFVDAQVGRVLDELSDLRLWESTVVVLWGDHGWKLGEHGAWGKLSNIEEDTRVPLIIAAPRNVIPVKYHGTETFGLVELVDLFPTLIDIAGIDIGISNDKTITTRNQLEGTSFKPLLIGSNVSNWKQAVFSQVARSGRGNNMMGYSMRTPRYRLTVWVNCEDLIIDMTVKPMAINMPYDENRRNSGKIESIELYDLLKDPLENENIGASNSVYSKNIIEKLMVLWRGDWKGVRSQLMSQMEN